MKVIKLVYLDEVDCIIEASYEILMEVQSHYTFQPKDFHVRKKFIPKWKHWNGNVKLVRINKGDSFLPIGLVPNVIKKFKDIYDIQLDSKLKKSFINKVDEDQFQEFIESLNIPKEIKGHEFEIREYQFESAYRAVKTKKQTLISPTSSGKSFILYLFTQWFLQHENGKVLLVVPRIGLVDQMVNDFKDYGFKGTAHGISAGVEKNSSQRIFVSTWQSIWDLDADYFKQFNCLIVDECHSIGNAVESKALISIIKNCTNATYKLAVTGTLDEGSELNIMELEGLIGPVHNVVSMQKLKEDKHVTPAQVFSIEVQLDKGTKQVIDALDYQKQVEFIESIDPPNPLNFLMIDIALNLKGNTLILFNRIESGHGPWLFDQIVKNDTKREDRIFYIDGSKSKEDRKKLVCAYEKHNDCIGVCSFGTFSTGINIKNLNSIFIASSTKSIYRTKQSVGRVLRLCTGKTIANVYDFHYNTKYSLKHYMERKGFYKEDSHPVYEKTLTSEEVVSIITKKHYI